MYFSIENEQIAKNTDNQWFDKENIFCVMTTSEWTSDTNFNKKRMIPQKPENIRFCKLERYSGHLMGTFRIPPKKHGQNSNVFQMYIFCNKIIFIDDSDFVIKHINKLISKNLHQLYDFFIRTLVKANIRKRSELIKEIIPMIEELRNSFQQAEKKVHMK